MSAFGDLPRLRATRDWIRRSEEDDVVEEIHRLEDALAEAEGIAEELRDQIAAHEEARDD